MIKKSVLVIILLLVPIGANAITYIDDQLKDVKKSIEFSPIKKHERDYVNTKYSFERAKGVEDPEVIHLSEFEPVKEKDFQEKLAKDEEVYKKKIAPKFYKNKKAEDITGVDFYNIYRIAERLIRANNLDYVNWKIAVQKTAEVNAVTFDGYNIRIYTGLYDSLYQNEDAMAFVLAHEMSHQILGHRQRSVEMGLRLNSIKQSIRSAKRSSNGSIALAVADAQLRRLMQECRRMEYMADTEALALLIRAGYSPYKAMEALSYLDAIGGNVGTVYDSHPLGTQRIESYKDNITIADPNWVNVGRENLYKSEVLTCKKSSDRVSVIINKSPKAKKFYHVETM